jgi:hypothetical protein
MAGGPKRIASSIFAARARRVGRESAQKNVHGRSVSSVDARKNRGPQIVVRAKLGFIDRVKKATIYSTNSHTRRNSARSNTTPIKVPMNTFASNPRRISAISQVVQAVPTCEPHFPPPIANNRLNGDPHTGLLVISPHQHIQHFQPTGSFFVSPAISSPVLSSRALSFHTQLRAFAKLAASAYSRTNMYVPYKMVKKNLQKAMRQKSSPVMLLPPYVSVTELRTLLKLDYTSCLKKVGVTTDHSTGRMSWRDHMGRTFETMNKRSVLVRETRLLD